MNAAEQLATTSGDEHTPEPAWAYQDFETLSEEEVVSVLLRRMRALIARGFDPTEALIGASRATLPIA
ncbi:MAG: hypothetical protein ACXVRJ_06630 [Gaiellaceae bacterium]